MIRAHVAGRMWLYQTLCKTHCHAQTLVAHGRTHAARPSALGPLRPIVRYMQPSVLRHTSGSSFGAFFMSGRWPRKAWCLQLAETKLKVDTVERERDFYFDKLRDIEILCQMPELQSIPVQPDQGLYACLLPYCWRPSMLCTSARRALLLTLCSTQ